MTPKEKANEIVNKFYELRAYETMALEGKRIAYGIAKDSAIICVEQILEAVTTIADKKYDYYKEVLEHLKSL